ncbi:hypothetical protein AJ79_06170 [Helicocarpus griseus UAMH5409]|uniref:DUF3500 domain-containing protein n=1 Tax=Helicocarpus griseus UAMH5409 TaxID=1447875 RepID=A0A2B7XGE9_9EURO|nr:hypothetical protein AJ79_06170 [Helicocarpus griseus UAMH5409]
MSTFEKSSAKFRQHLPDLNTPRFQNAKDQDAYSYAATFQETKNPPWLYNLTKAWEQLYEEPYKGLTTDGNIIPGLFHQQDEGIPIDLIVNATNKVTNMLSPEQLKQLTYPLNAKEWRAWSNPEFLLRPSGLRLDELSEDVATAILGVIEATLSPEGYTKALSAMRINHFLGELVNMPRIMNKYSYNFLLFGTPSTTEPWGWLLYGHHLCLSVFLKSRQIIVSPTFIGAEPNIIDEGEFSGTEICRVEGMLGLQLMQDLPEGLKQKAQIFKLLRDPGMLQTGDLKIDRWNRDDQRCLCSAFRDNRVVPYEGVCVSEFTNGQQGLVLDIAEQFLIYLPERARALRKEQIRKYFHETFFCWIGGYGNDDAYYFRIQSPVVVFEFDHHSGVFLTNEEPKKFHIHTVVRTPNGGDYGCGIRTAEEIL